MIGNALIYWQDGKNHVGKHHEEIWDAAEDFVKKHKGEIEDVFKKSRILCGCTK